MAGGGPGRAHAAFARKPRWPSSPCWRAFIPRCGFARLFHDSNWNALEGIRYVTRNSAPWETTFDGFSGLGLFRPQAFYHPYQHWHTLAIQTEAQRRHLVGALASGAALPKLVFWDHYLREGVPAEAARFIEAHYARGGTRADPGPASSTTAWAGGRTRRCGRWAGRRAWSGRPTCCAATAGATRRRWTASRAAARAGAGRTWSCRSATRETSGCGSYAKAGPDGLPVEVELLVNGASAGVAAAAPRWQEYTFAARARRPAARLQRLQAAAARDRRGAARARGGHPHPGARRRRLRSFDTRGGRAVDSPLTSEACLVHGTHRRGVRPAARRSRARVRALQPRRPHHHRPRPQRRGLRLLRLLRRQGLHACPQLLRAGGLVALVASIFDMLDGRVARLRGRETTFGAFLDSTMDRYSDMVLYMGLLILYARVDKTPHMVLVWVAAFGSFMTSYARARAESLIPHCTVGFLERPGAHGADHRRRPHQPHGGGALDHRRALERHRPPARRLHLRRAEEGLGAAARRSDAP